MLECRRKAASKGIRLEILPVELLADIKADIEALSRAEELNGYQQWIINDRYVLEVPKLDFKAKSIVIAACELSLSKAVFTDGHATLQDLFEYPKLKLTDELGRLFEAEGYHLRFMNWLPQKRLAVCSGLAEYGRNNITYAEGWGSFIKLAAFFSDAPWSSYTWRGVKDMDACEKCGACVRSCPTGAILPDRFLIDNERCMTRVVEAGTEDFPEWVPRSALHHITGCLRCQAVCPANRDKLSNITESVLFPEEETALLLKGLKREELPQSLLRKLEYYDVDWVLKSFPRNLKAMFENIEKARV